jgi:hypothetical protein
MTLDELRLLVGVRENYRRGALRQLRCHKGPFTRVRPATPPRLAGVVLEFSFKKK